MPDTYKDYINAYGYGVDFIDKLRKEEGHKFAKEI